MDSQDRRTKRQKLQDMANQQASPKEAEIARKKLEELGSEPEEQHISFLKTTETTITFTVNMTPEGFEFFRAWYNPTVSGFGEY